MIYPNYKNGSIVNLMSSITSACGDKPMYEPLDSIDSTELSKSKNILLVVIDGLGYEYLMANGEGSIFSEYLHDKLTAVYPSTTAASITSFLTGVAPQQHAITGWFVYLKELGTISAILPFIPRYGGNPFNSNEINTAMIFYQSNLFKNINRKSYVVTKKELINSAYNKTYNKEPKMCLYKNSIKDFIKKVKKALKYNNEKKFIYAYWPEFDYLSHQFGANSNEVKEHFKELDVKFSNLLKSIHNTDTSILITADHGFIDTNESKTIYLKDHPELAKTLTLPLSGDARNAYCYVRPSKTEEFENYILNNLNYACQLYKSEDLIKKNFFGLYEPNKKLFDRIGDYTLIMKENYIIKDFVLGEEEKSLIGYHGGMSKEEMFVPLIVIKT
ncbi:MAG: alkaline phosphatase family protein [Candidatus Cloacimonadota bacterium]|nr:alkaline phosphatase family protein [Candidatus Cloacimonadota bacterium]